MKAILCITYGSVPQLLSEVRLGMNIKTGIVYCGEPFYRDKKTRIIMAELQYVEINTARFANTHILSRLKLDSATAFENTMCMQNCVPTNVHI